MDLYHISYTVLLLRAKLLSCQVASAMANPMISTSSMLTIDDFEQAASRILLPMARDYYNGGTLDSVTLERNRQACNS